MSLLVGKLVSASFWGMEMQHLQFMFLVAVVAHVHRQFRARSCVNQEREQELAEPHRTIHFHFVVLISTD